MQRQAPGINRTTCESLIALTLYLITIANHPLCKYGKKASEYDQEIPQSHTADQPTHREEAPQNTDCHKTSGMQLKQSNQFSLPHQDYCKSRRTQSTKWTSTQKTCLRWFVNNTGADQPTHPRSLISAFVMHVFEIIICRLATGEISIF